MTRKGKNIKSKYEDVMYTHPVLCPDGKYRWVFDLPMLTNPSILFTVYKVMTMSFAIVWLFVLLVGACEGHLRLSDVWDSTYPFILLIALFLVIGYVAYFFVAWHYGWKYSILFIMDEKEIVHKQLPSTIHKARAIGKLTAMTGKPAMVGLGILAATRTSMSTPYDSVRRIIPRRRWNLIKVNERLSHNQVYAAEEDFDFVYNYLCQHCPLARIG